MLSMDFTGARNSHKLPYHKFPPHSHKLPPLLEFLIGDPPKKKSTNVGVIPCHTQRIAAKTSRGQHHWLNKRRLSASSARRDPLRGSPESLEIDDLVKQMVNQPKWDRHG